MPSSTGGGLGMPGPSGSYWGGGGGGGGGYGGSNTAGKGGGPGGPHAGGGDGTTLSGTPTALSTDPAPNGFQNTFGGAGGGGVENHNGGAPVQRGGLWFRSCSPCLPNINTHKSVQFYN